MSAEIFAFALLLVSLLLAITVIDARTQRIPDVLNLGLALGGLGFQLRTHLDVILQQLLFSAGVGLLFLAVRFIHHRLTGVIGMGLGDVKMAGAGAMWFSPLLFPLFLFTASLSALVFALILRVGDGSASWRLRLPFGPFLALGIVVAFGLETL